MFIPSQDSCCSWQHFITLTRQYYSLINDYISSALYDKVEMDTADKHNQIYVAVSSDRGLCGALHSNIGRALKSEYEKKTAEEDIKIVTIGEKAKAFLQR